jgi:hypothetical protein
MAKVTDRYDNKNLINLAKKQYDKKQKSKLPADIVKIPSGGKIYPADSILRKGGLEMRHMTAYDEDILTNATYIRDGIVLDKLLEALILDDIHIDEIAIFDKEALLINARISAYGGNYPIIVTDPKTSKQINSEIDLNNLTFDSVEIDTDDNGECTYYCENGTQLKYSYAPRKEKIDSSSSNIISSFLLRTIRQVNETRSISDIEKFIRYDFSFKESKKFQKHVTDNQPGVLTEIEVTGEDGGTFTAGFQFGPKLFWPES